nr:Chain A, PaDBS1R7 [Pyrobaculum aerophilum str. IM2]
PMARNKPKILKRILAKIFK